LGPRLGGVWKGIWRSYYHGGVFLYYHDCSLQGARSRVGLAEGSYQMVAVSEPAAIEASSLRVRRASKYFAAINGAAVGGLALDKVSLFVSAGELVSVVGPSGCGKPTLVLLLDEPLGALDAFTRMRMQDEVLRLWRVHRTTMLLVTHDIDEAIYMSDRIVIMTPPPGRIEQIIPVKMDRPRDRSSPDFLRL